MNVVVTAAPVIDYDASLSQRQKLKGGSTLILMVNIKGEPKPEARWFLDDQEITADARVKIEGDGTYSRLTVTKTSAKDAGKYRVAAENSVGSDSAEFTVAVTGKQV